MKGIKIIRTEVVDTYQLQVSSQQNALMKDKEIYVKRLMTMIIEASMLDNKATKLNLME